MGLGWGKRAWVSAAAPLIAAAVLVIGPGAGAMSGQESGLPDPPEPHVPGPVDPGYEGPAYVVPTDPEPADPNSIEAEVLDHDGEPVGTTRLAAGKAVEVVVSTDEEGDIVTVELDDGRSARAPATEFWSMPSFLGLGGIKVDQAGRTRPLPLSGVRYHRGSPGMYDDPATPGYDGISRRAREVLACTSEDDEWSIGQQTFTVDFIEQGVHLGGERMLIDKGIVGLRWGANLDINDAGVFEIDRTCNGEPEAVADRGGTHHATQYLESMGRATYLMAASPYAGELRPIIDETIGNIDRLAGLLSKSPGPWDEWYDHVSDPHGDDYTHRTFMMAAGLGMASTLTEDEVDAQRWRDLAESIARRGIGNQWDEGEVGVFPERGGYDLMYHMYGTWLAQVYLGTLPADAPVRSDLHEAIQLAIDWDLNRIDPETGLIYSRGSSRICVQTNWWSDEQSTRVDPAETIRALLLWGYTESDRDYIETAVLIDQGEKETGNLCPRPQDPSDPAAATPGPSADGGGTSAFETPIGTLSTKRVLAAAAAGVVALVVVSQLHLGTLARRLRIGTLARRLHLGRLAPYARRLTSICVPVAVFGLGLVLLAA